jgi:hypothetical protein
VNLPNGQVLYARRWTEDGGVWRYKDSTFGGTALRAIMNYPRDGPANADLTWPIQWC